MSTVLPAYVTSTLFIPSVSAVSSVGLKTKSFAVTSPYATSFVVLSDIVTVRTSDEKVTVTYAGKTAEIGIEVKADTPVEPEKPTVDKIAVKKVPAKTTYKAGETFDPSGLVHTVTKIGRAHV